MKIIDLLSCISRLKEYCKYSGYVLSNVELDETLLGRTPRGHHYIITDVYDSDGIIHYIKVGTAYIHDLKSVNWDEASAKYINETISI